MKRKTLVAIAILAFLAMGCKSKRAMNYNDMIVDQQGKLAEAMDEEAPRLRRYFANYQYDSIVSASSRMEATIDTIISNINKKPVPKVSQGANFKKVALQYFNYMKDIYTSYKNYGKETTPDGREIQMQVITKLINGEDQVVAEMQRAQQIFAKNNGFKIKPAAQKGNSSFTAQAPGS